MAEPPVVDAVVAPVKLTVAWPLPAVATRAVGGAGRVCGVIDAEAAEVGPVPLPFTSLTVTV